MNLQPLKAHLSMTGRNNVLTNLRWNMQNYCQRLKKLNEISSCEKVEEVGKPKFNGK